MIFFKENSLVNSVGEDMNLGQGKVAPVISKKAGPKLQEECNRLAPIKNGEVKATDAYKMKPCKKILHCCLPKFTSSREIQVTYYHVNSRDVAIQCFYAHDFNSNSALDSVHIFLFKLSSCSKLDVNPIQNTIQTLMFHKFTIRIGLSNLILFEKRSIHSKLYFVRTTALFSLCLHCSTT